MVIVIAGATAVGKSDFAIKVAKEINGEIISADSMQIYRGFDIGTAKLTAKEMSGIPHYMIDCVEGDVNFSVSEYKNAVMPIINDIMSRNKIPILVGGTGLYIDAVLHPFKFGTFCPQAREKYNKLAQEIGNEKLHQLLEEKSSSLASTIHPNNVKRVIRALEVLDMGEDFSADKEQNEFDYTYIVLNMPRELLYTRVEQRVDIMIESGLEDEVKNLSSQLGWETQSMQAIGYKEWRKYFEGESTLAETVDLIKKNSRHYVKRQLTWFRAKKEAVWFGKDQLNDALIYIKQRIGINKNE